MYLRSTEMAASAPISSTLYVWEWPPRLSVTLPCARGVEHPVRGSIAGHQPALAAHLDHVHGGRVQLSSFPPWHGEDLAVRRSQPKLRQSAKPRVDQPGSEVPLVGLSHALRSVDDRSCCRKHRSRRRISARLSLRFAVTSEDS